MQKLCTRFIFFSFLFVCGCALSVFIAKEWRRFFLLLLCVWVCGEVKVLLPGLTLDRYRERERVEKEKRRSAASASAAIFAQQRKTEQT